MGRIINYNLKDEIIMKYLANYISISRIIMSIILIVPKTFTIAFYIIYVYCGISDMLDGYNERKSKNTSKIGSRLDSVADIIFVIIAMIKILPTLSLSNVIIIWTVIIALIRIINVVCAYIYYNKAVILHTIANKITGFGLFIAPLLVQYVDLLLIEIIICIVATFAAIQEGHYIRTGKVGKVIKYE